MRCGIRSLFRGGRAAPRTRTTVPIHPHQQRFASYQRFGQGVGGKQYSRFPPVARAQFVWRSYRTPILIVGAGGGTFYVANLEEVPVSHRRRFNCISPETEQQMVAGGGYEQILQEFQGKVLPESHPYTQLVGRVVQRLLPSTGLADQEWKVHVIDAPQERNAFVIPGGKVFVFTGILPVCQDEDGLATVLGHEIAHNVAHHAAEKLSRSVLILPIVFLTSYVLDVSGQLASTAIDLVLSLPNGRAQESEADYIGLLMMAQSCYDPEAAVGFWQRMKQAQAGQGAPPQFLSTHPSDYNRIGAIEGWLPQAKQKYSDSECGMTSARMDDFRGAFSRQQEKSLPSRQWSKTQQSGDDDYFF